MNELNNVYTLFSGNTYHVKDIVSITKIETKVKSNPEKSNIFDIFKPLSKVHVINQSHFRIITTDNVLYAYSELEYGTADRKYYIDDDLDELHDEIIKKWNNYNYGKK